MLRSPEAFESPRRKPVGATPCRLTTMPEIFGFPSGESGSPIEGSGGVSAMLRTPSPTVASYLSAEAAALPHSCCELRRSASGFVITATLLFGHATKLHGSEE